MVPARRARIYQCPRSGPPSGRAACLERGRQGCRAQRPEPHIGRHGQIREPPSRAKPGRRRRGCAATARRASFLVCARFCRTPLSILEYRGSPSGRRSRRAGRSPAGAAGAATRPRVDRSMWDVCFLRDQRERWWRAKRAYLVLMPSLDFGVRGLLAWFFSRLHNLTRGRGITILVQIVASLLSGLPGFQFDFEIRGAANGPRGHL